MTAAFAVYAEQVGPAGVVQSAASALQSAAWSELWDTLTRCVRAEKIVPLFTVLETQVPVLGFGVGMHTHGKPDLPRQPSDSSHGDAARTKQRVHWPPVVVDILTIDLMMRRLVVCRCHSPNKDLHRMPDPTSDL